MAESVLRIRAEFDPSSLITGLRDAADALEAKHVGGTVVASMDGTTSVIPGNVTVDEALDELEGMVTQHCYSMPGGVYETSALSANRDAFDLLVRAGRAEYVGPEPFGRMATIRLLPPVAAAEQPMSEADRLLAEARQDHVLLSLLDPDCRAGKHGTCVGGPCSCPCHIPTDGGS